MPERCERIDELRRGIPWIFEIESPIQLGWWFLAQFWCNWDGKGGLCGLDRFSLVISIERLDIIYPHGKDVQSTRPIRTQTLYPLSYGYVGRYYIAETYYVRKKRSKHSV